LKGQLWTGVYSILGFVAQLKAIDHDLKECEAAQGEFAYCKCDQECKMLASVS
jgi:hypothetical protein